MATFVLKNAFTYLQLFDVRSRFEQTFFFSLLFFFVSALYVIDLKRFRRLAAGDRLRGQYQVRYMAVIERIFEIYVDTSEPMHGIFYLITETNFFFFF